MMLGMDAGALHALTLISLTCLGWRLIFTVQVADKLVADNLKDNQQSEKSLAFVRDYAVKQRQKMQ